MCTKPRQNAFTLIEMTVVVAIVALLAGLGLPAIRALFNAFESRSNVQATISAALSSARAIAAKEQRYAGIRFQCAANLRDIDKVLESPQYMIFIVYEEPANMNNLTIAFRAVEGMQPIRLPDSVCVMDMRIRTDWAHPDNGSDEAVDGNNDIDEAREIRDTTSFSIIFSPTGKLVIHSVRTRNRDGDPTPTTLNDSMDDIFNSPENIVDNGVGMFIQDDYAELGLGEELSRNSFYIFDKNTLQNVQPNRRWTDYLEGLAPHHINAYTGTMIRKGAVAEISD